MTMIHSEKTTTTIANTTTQTTANTAANTTANTRTIATASTALLFLARSLSIGEDLGEECEHEDRWCSHNCNIDRNNKKPKDKDGKHWQHADADTQPHMNTYHPDNHRKRIGFHSLCSDPLHRSFSSYTRITMIRQSESWDCGVACLLMVAKWLSSASTLKSSPLGSANTSANTSANISANETKRIAWEEQLRTDILSRIGTQSIWTSDLLWELESWKNTTHNSLASDDGTDDGTDHEGRLCPAKQDDFAFVLASRQVMGADESYRNLGYYHDAFDADRSRVAKTFCRLHHKGVPMLQTTTCSELREQRNSDPAPSGLSLKTVVALVRRPDCLAIILLNNYVLWSEGRPSAMKSNADTNTINNTTPIINEDENHHQNTTTATFMAAGKTNTNTTHADLDPPESNHADHYAGHYVVLCGISRDPKHLDRAHGRSQNRNETNEIERAIENENDFCFVVCNPDSSLERLSSSSLRADGFTRRTDLEEEAEFMFVSPQRLETAWRSNGTDEDVIFIRKTPPRQSFCDSPQLQPQPKGEFPTRQPTSLLPTLVHPPPQSLRHESGRGWFHTRATNISTISLGKDPPFSTQENGDSVVCDERRRWGWRDAILRILSAPAQKQIDAEETREPWIKTIPR